MGGAVNEEATTVLEVPGAEAMERLGRRIGRLLRAGDVVVLDGPLGAGKTTLARGVGEALGVRGRVSSPTFVIARSHEAQGPGPGLVHVDAYRLRDPLELADLDLELERNATLIEWGAEFVGAVADAWLHVRIERGGAPGAAAGTEAEDDEAGDEPRTVRIRGVGRRWDAASLAALA